MPADATASRRRALERALLACYELIDKFRRELAELDAGKPRAP
jgi:hypothetical protein